MNNFPLVRGKWTNEHIMTGVFLASVLYLLPRWFSSPRLILEFALVLTLGFAVDTVANFIHYKRPVCSVSAGVTAAIIEILAFGIPLSGRLLAIIISLIIGKHIWGGTGKNIYNPAIIGFVSSALLFKPENHIFTQNLTVLPALILSLFFIKSRPFAALGLMSGMLLVLITKQEFNINGIISSGVVFWSCIVITDPVTINPLSYFGFPAGFILGFLTLMFQWSNIYIAIGILVLNLISYLTEDLSIHKVNNKGIQLKRFVRFIYEKTSFIDLTNDETTSNVDIEDLSEDDILEGIKKSELFGLGGGAFPTYNKIRSVLNSNAPEKHLIVNGVECDPGLIHDKWLLRRYPDAIIKGTQLLSKCTDFKSVTLAVKDVEGLELPSSTNVYRVKNYYPAGAERYLVHEILEKDLEYGSFPAEEGILVLNIQTVYAIYECLTMNKMAHTRFITAANLRDGSSNVLKVRLDNKVMDIVKHVYPNASYAFCGGGIMQCHTADEDEVIGKTVTFIGVSDFPRYKESPQCSKCSFCTSHCPAGLRVNKIADLISKGKLDDMEKYHPERCIRCGICSYGCLAGRNIQIHKIKDRLIK